MFILFQQDTVHSVCFFMSIMTNGHMINDNRNPELFPNADG